MIAGRMAEAGISNMGAYMRKMALNGYVLHVDLSDIRELVALQRRCANNLNQVAVMPIPTASILGDRGAQRTMLTFGSLYLIAKTCSNHWSNKVGVQLNPDCTPTFILILTLSYVFFQSPGRKQEVSNL